MTEHRDELMEFVRASNPVEDRTLKGWVESEEALEIHDELLTRIRLTDASPPMRPKRRGVLVAALGTALVATVAGAAYLMDSRPTTEVFTIGCSSDPSGQEMTIVPIRGDDSPEDVCLKEWAYQGEEIPSNVVACIIPEGGTVVYPNPSNMSPRDFCSSIGASMQVEGDIYGGLTAEEVRTMVKELDAHIVTLREGEECYPVSDLKKGVEGFLISNGIDQWTIRDGTSPNHPLHASNGQRCARYVIEATSAAIILVDGDPAA